VVGSVIDRCMVQSAVPVCTVEQGRPC
jgi:hypothetical protein